MLSSLQIQNFRGLKDVKINSLGRVNLIVGENNAGKSSVLEALRIYASGGNPLILEFIAESHHEIGLLDYHFKKNFHNFESGLQPYSDFFYQRQYPVSDENNIKIISNKHRIYIKKYQDENIIYVLHKDNIKYEIPLFSSDDKYLSNFKLERPIARSLYISTLFTENKVLASYWDKVTLTPYENELIDSLKIIEPNIEKLAFISQYTNGKDRIPVVKLKNSDKPVPLYSMGDGIKRILQLILNLHQAKDGLLLIDEFDNGLHYKVQEKVWGLLFELAERFNVQVFATTHSNDCIRAFSKISKERTDIDGMLIQMVKKHFKDGSSQIVANVVDENQLQRLLNLGVDVR